VVTYTATDAAGNETTATFKVTVLDNVTPILVQSRSWNFSKIVKTTAEGISLTIPTDLSGNWNFRLFDVKGNLTNKLNISDIGGSTYQWDLQNTSGRHILVSVYKAKNGSVEKMSRVIGFKK